MSGPKDTLRIYDARAKDYAARNEKLYELVDAEAFAAALPAGSAVLDLGCGPGQYAAWFAAQGFDVTAWDGSTAMIDLASQHAGVTARQARFEELSDTATYDGIWANFSLLHLPRAELPDVLTRIHRALKPEGRFHIGMKLGTGEGPDQIGRFYSYYSENELREFLGAAGFSVTSARHFSGKGLDGTAGAYITLTCHG